MATSWDLKTMSAGIPGKDKLMLFYSGIKALDSVTRPLQQVSAVIGNIQDTLELIDLPLPLRLMMFRLKRHDGTVAPIPELILRVNPESFTVSYKKKSDLVYTTGGFVVQHWHEDKMTIRASGWVPSFRGRAKILTEGYQMFLGLLNIYTQCGNVQKFLGQQLISKDLDIDYFTKAYTDTQVKNSLNPVTGKEEKVFERRVPETLVMYPKVELFYQNDVYEGMFTDFTSKENYETPNTLQYDFTFIADKKTDTVLGSLGGGLGTMSRILRPFASFSGPRLK